MRAGARELATEWASAFKSKQFDRSLWTYPAAWLGGDYQITMGWRDLDAVSTPGHPQGHYVFADQSVGLLFAGDHTAYEVAGDPAVDPT